MSRKLKVLIIDDTARYASSLKDFLEIRGHEVLTKHLPKEGIEAMNHTFDVVFIDHIYDNDTSVNGADVGWAIRKKYSLASLIMITGYWAEPERIKEFIWVGFDSFLPKHKEGDKIDVINKNREDALQTAITNAQRRIKSRFTEEELADERAALDRFEAVAKIEKRVIYLAPAEHILRIDPSFYDNANKKINDEKQSDFFNNFVYQTHRQNIFHGTPLNKQTSLNAHFKVYEKGLFVAEEPALKVRQLLIENPSKWLNFRNCSPLKDSTRGKGFLSHFDIE
jgi:ActR/RegA family two-component response regulator